MGKPSSPPPHMHRLPLSGEAVAARYLFLGADRRVAFVDRSIELLWGLTAPALRNDPRLWL